MKKYKVGVDEAGRGPWLGPVVACSLAFESVNLPDRDFFVSLKDSKKLSAEKREKIFEEIIKLANLDNPKVYFGIGVVDNHMIDEINIKKANKEAMRRSLDDLFLKINRNDTDSVLIDGNDNYQFENLEKKPIYIIGGDDKVDEIKAASIVAKVFRDKLMNTYSVLYPSLDISSHKGYGTKKHREYLTDKSKITSIHRKSYKPVKEVLEKKEKLLLHVCCGPDATIPIVDLKDKFELICYWYDPNIQPKKEYTKRLNAFKKVCEIEGVEYIEGEYDVDNFLKTIKGYENTPEKGKKCELCYDMRLVSTAKLAKDMGVNSFTTTLTISPHKDNKKIFELGEKVASNYNLEFKKISFRKNNGFLRSVEYTTEHKIYRQGYCGCIYSDSFPGINR